MAQLQPLLKPLRPKINWGQPLTQGLIFDAPLWEGAGLSKTKELASNLDGTIAASGATWDKNFYGADLDFSAAASKVSFTTPAKVNSLVKGSVETMVLIRGAGGGNNGRFFGKVNGANLDYFRVYFDDVNHLVYFQQDWFTNKFINLTQTADGLWHHWIFTCTDFTSTASNTMSMYKDGVSQTPTTTQNGSGAAPSDGTDLFIGNRSDGLRNINGKISYVRFWNRVLTATEARLLYTNPWQIYQLPNFNFVPTAPIATTTSTTSSSSSSSTSSTSSSSSTSSTSSSTSSTSSSSSTSSTSSSTSSTSSSSSTSSTSSSSISTSSTSSSSSTSSTSSSSSTSSTSSSTSSTSSSSSTSSTSSSTSSTSSSSSTSSTSSSTSSTSSSSSISTSSSSSSSSTSTSQTGTTSSSSSSTSSTSSSTSSTSTSQTGTTSSSSSSSSSTSSTSSSSSSSTSSTSSSTIMYQPVIDILKEQNRAEFLPDQIKIDIQQTTENIDIRDDVN